MAAWQFDAVDSARSWISNARYDDIDAQAAQLRGYGQRYVQLSRGKFEGRFASFVLGDHVSIHFERSNSLLAQSGRSPTGRYTACVLTADSPPCRLDGTEVTSGDVVLWPPGYSWEALTPPGMTICVVDLASTVVADSRRIHRSARLIKDPPAANRLREFVDSGLAQLQANVDALGQSAATRNFAAILGALLPDPPIAPAGDERPGMRAKARRFQMFKRARDTIHENLASGICVSSLCTQVGMSRRSLETLFLSISGTTPAHYIRTLQLNEIRRALLTEENARSSIGDVAARWGVWHWSRFAGNYRKMFDELPSQTRRFAAARAARRRTPQEADFLAR
jgi:AraC family ethanolamine operon transcriptional activator